MAYHEMPFSARFGVLGDEAEGHFERICTNPTERWGLVRPKLHMASLPERIREAPDYLLSNRFVEVKGMGRDDILKLKVSSYQSLNWWDHTHPVHLWIWSSHRWAYADHPIIEIRAMIDGGEVELATFHDGKAYFAIPGRLLNWTELERV